MWSDSHFPLSAGVDAAGLTLRPLLQDIYHQVPFYNIGLPGGVSLSPSVEFLHLQSFSTISLKCTTPQSKKPRDTFYKTLRCCPPLAIHVIAAGAARTRLK